MRQIFFLFLPGLIIAAALLGVVSFCSCSFPASEGFSIELFLPPGPLSGEQWCLSYPGSDGRIKSVMVSSSEKSIRLETDRWSWLPFLLRSRAGGISWGGIVWLDASGPADEAPYWRDPPSMPLSGSPAAIDLSTSAGPLAELLVSLWPYRKEFAGLNLERLHREMVKKSSGELRRINLQRLQSDLLYHSLSSYSITLLQRADRSFYLPRVWTPEELLLFLPEDPASSIMASLNTGGELSVLGLYKGMHLFYAEDLELLLWFDGVQCNWRLIRK
jgi:hypothetical protein